MITLVYAYYDNPGMLAEHLRIWRGYPQHVKDHVEVVVTDDASPREPARIEPVGFPIALYRIDNDVPWNWLQCRNIGARHARHQWLLLTDMDHALVGEQAERLLELLDDLRRDGFYTLNRRDAPDHTPYKHHPDSYVMTKTFFWQVGGYDEHYAGYYGTSGLWRRRCGKHGLPGHIEGAYLLRYPGEHMPDARTSTLPRKEGRDPHQIKRISERLEALGHTSPLICAQPHHLVQEFPAC